MNDPAPSVVARDERLATLDRYDILDTPQEEAFDRITRLVTRTFGVPTSTVTLVDGHRQWFKSRQGLACTETPLAPSFCAVALGESEPLVIPDAKADPRFADNPLVVGEPFVRFYAGVPLRAPNGHAIGTLCAIDTKPRAFGREELDTLVDLARIAETELELRLLASKDSLTGSMSRGAFKAEAARAIALARRHGHPLSCLMIDLDHFKRINDGHGHAMGDLVLAEAAATCRNALRETDLVGRLGGEEFAAILYHTDRPAAFDTAERLRLAIARLRVLTPAGLLSVSASFGVATLGPDVPDLDSLLGKADEALYLAKAEGRNRSVAWRGELSTQPLTGKRRVLKAGQITFNGGRSVIDCTVRALSDGEADLNVASTADIPESFKLRIEADGFSKLCHVRRRRERQVAVQFG